MRRKPSKKDVLQVQAFNRDYPVGGAVRFWTGVREGKGRTGRTWTPAQLLGGVYGEAVVYIRDDSGKNVGCVALSHVAPLLTAAPDAPSCDEQSPPKEEETFLPEGKQ